MGAGGIYSTTSDLVKFSNAIFNGELIKPEQHELMKTIKDYHGYGLFESNFKDAKGYGHDGVIDQFESRFAYFPKSNISIAIFTNGARYNIFEISEAIVSAVHNKAFDIPEFKSIQITSKELYQIYYDMSVIVAIFGVCHTHQK